MAKKCSWLSIFFFLAFCASMFGNMVLLALLGVSNAATEKSIRLLHEYDYEEVVLDELNGGGAKIAVIPLSGVIEYDGEGSLGESMVTDLKRAFRQALRDPSVAAVVLSVNSPGGEITASDVIHHELKKLAANKPVVVFINSIGASGAYYIACGADWIMCNPTSFTGSIGVIISTLNYGGLFNKVGLESVIFKSGAFKDMLNGARPISPDEKAYVQSLVMETYDRFLNIVAESRKLSAESLRNGPADGRILSGENAYADKLVDQLGYIEDAYEKAMELAGINRATVVKYKPSFHFTNFLRFLKSRSEGATVKFDIFNEQYALKPGRVYLLPGF